MKEPPKFGRALHLIDGHTHVVSGDGQRYPMDVSLGADLDWHHERPIDADAMMRTAHAAGVRGVVVVQSLSCHGYDNRYVLASAQRFDRTIAVGALNPDDPGALTALRREVVDGGMRGVRVSAHGTPPSFDSPSMRTIVAEAADLEVPVVLVGGAAHLPSLAQLAVAFPSVSFVVDHCGFADLRDPATLPAAGALLTLAEQPNVICKVSSINLQATTDPSALWSTLVEHFGSERLLWGSDYPHSDGPGYDELVRVACTTTEHLAASEQAYVLGGTARCLWSALA